MLRSANRQTRKLVKRCPRCGSMRPKEYVEVELPGLPAILHVLLGLLTFGLWFLVFLAPRPTQLKLYCSRCDKVF